MGAAADAYPDRAFEWQTTDLDPNARRIWNGQSGGARLLPMSTRGHARCGARERLTDVEQRRRDRLTLRLNAEVTRIVVEDGRATEVVYRHEGHERRARAGREIVIAAGTFLSPQLLMLSGIGDPAELSRHGIASTVDLPGVGRNMQDRYEIGVVTRMKKPWAALNGVTYSTTDRNYRLWKRFRLGNFTSNGALFAAALKSRPNLPIPDLLCFALLADFRGYATDYSKRLLARDYLTWIVLKAYTSNNAGTVTLRSADIADPPRINFRYFDEGSPGGDGDLDAMVTGVRFVRKIAESMGELVALEEEPGRHRLTDGSLRDYVRDNAWGHHACGTCAMLPRDRCGVVDSRFRVHGVEGLRVVDASVFPRIPGYFPVSAVYMIAEKAADTILTSLSEAVPSHTARETTDRPTAPPRTRADARRPDPPSTSAMS
jgi:choline dehydrogenase